MLWHGVPGVYTNTSSPGGKSLSMSIEADSSDPLRCTRASLTTDELLSHASWVRGVAYALVRDAATADDLVQETWLAALRRPPEGDRPVRPWLAGVVRNLVRQRHRGETRREQREEVAARRQASEPLPSPAELAARLDTQQRLTAHVKELPEPFRATVLLRYFEGLAAAEIARRNGVPAGTVRWRLKKALELLRERLDAEHDGDRRAWVLALVPLAASAAPTPSPASPGTTATGNATAKGLGRIAAIAQGVLVMSLGVKWILGGVAVAILGLWAVTGLGTNIDDETAPEQAVDVGFRPEARTRVRKRTKTELPTPETDGTSPDGTTPGATKSDRTAARPAVLEGRTLDERGVGLPGIPFTCNFDSAFAATSSDNGTFRAELTVPDGIRTVELEFAAEGRVTVKAAVPVVSGETAYVGDITLAPGGGVSGRIVDEQNQPVAGAWVGLASADDLDGMSYGRRRRIHRRPHGSAVTGTTSTDGTFTLDGVPTGQIRIWTGGDDYLSTLSGPIEVRVGMQSFGVDLVLERIPADELITGVVLSPDGKPVAHASVRYSYKSLWSGSGSGSMTAGADGRFQLVLHRKATYQLSATDRQERWGGVSIDEVQGGARDVELRMVESRFVDLRVVDAAGAPVSAFSVSLSDPTIGMLFDFFEFEDVDTTPVRVRLPGQRFHVSVEADGYSAAELGPLDPEAVNDALRIQLTSLPGLRGSVTRDGDPVEGARVKVMSVIPEGSMLVHNDFPARWNPRGDADGTTDVTGGYDLTVREAGMYVLRVEHDGLAPFETRPFTFDPQIGLTRDPIALTQGGTLEGLVVADGDASPAGTIVGISRADGHAQSQRVGPDGRYRFEHLAPGGWVVRRLQNDQNTGGTTQTTTRGTFTPKWDCRVREGAVTKHDLNAGGLSRARLEGLILVGGKPAKGWRVQLLSSTGGLVRTGAGGIRLERSVATTTDTGAFALDDLAPGNYRALVRPPADQTRLFREVELVPGVNTLDLHLNLGGLTITNVPTMNAGAPLPRLAHVWTNPDGWTAITPLVPNADGLCSLERAPAGEGRIARYDPKTDGQDVSRWETVRSVTVPRGETIEVVLD